MQSGQPRNAAPASSSVMSRRRPILRKSSLLVITLGPLDNENTVAPFAENVFATVESRPFIIVTTAIIEATPTITPSNVRNV
ncbi:hypothetical protein OFC63_30070, partial [Escherichia coli]|nr:hypothetical protein [Escherichia coli]